MSCLLRSLLKNSEVKIFKEVIGLEGKCYREMKSSRRWLSIYKNNGAEREKRILELLLIRSFQSSKAKQNNAVLNLLLSTTKCTQSFHPSVVHFPYNLSLCCQRIFTVVFEPPEWNLMGWNTSFKNVFWSDDTVVEITKKVSFKSIQNSLRSLELIFELVT